MKEGKVKGNEENKKKEKERGEGREREKEGWRRGLKREREIEKQR